jgi:D-serine dehydratase
MSSALQHLSRGQLSQMPPLLVGGAIEDVSSVEAELARHLPHIRRMSKQLKSTSQQIETSVVEVSTTFKGLRSGQGPPRIAPGDFSAANTKGLPTGNHLEASSGIVARLWSRS